jgi:hypothetical protein
MNEQRANNQAITSYASLLNAAHLLAEESALRLQGLAARYPDAFPPETLPGLAGSSDEETCPIATDLASG